MSKLTLGAVCLTAVLALAGAASAAPRDWSGAYVGVNAGGDWRGASVGDSAEQINNLSGVFVPQRGIIIVPGFTTDVPATSHTDGGSVWGGQVGFNAQSGAWVYGAEGDLDAGSGKVSTSFGENLPTTALTPGRDLQALTGVAASTSFSATRQVSWSQDWSVRGRIGYARGRFLLYGTGGVAGAKANVSFTDTWADLPGGFAAPNALTGAPAACFFGANYNPANCPGTANVGPVGPIVTSGRQSQTHIGWTAGAGGEMAMSRRLSLGVEYRHTDLGSKSYLPTNPTTSINGPTATQSGGAPAYGQAFPGATRISLSDDRVTVRINWRFWTGRH